jgi:hypothetical protein
MNSFSVPGTMSISVTQGAEDVLGRDSKVGCQGAGIADKSFGPNDDPQLN